jgi:hypothetical protein
MIQIKNRKSHVCGPVAKIEKLLIGHSLQFLIFDLRLFFYCKRLWPGCYFNISLGVWEIGEAQEQKSWLAIWGRKTYSVRTKILGKLIGYEV